MRFFSRRRLPPQQMTISDKNKGIALCLLSSLIVVTQDALSKELLQHFAIAQIIFLRQLVFILFSFWWVTRGGGGWRRFCGVFAATKGVKLQVLRSVMMVAEIGVFFWGLRYVGIAKAHSIFMLFPILATLIAVLWLREEATKILAFALLAGFAGAMLIIRPGSGVFQPEALIILLASSMFALYNVMTRRATERDGFAVSMVYMGVIGALATAPFAFYFWQPSSDPLHWLLMGLLTITGAAAHLLIVKSLEYAPASVLQPYNYVLVVWAVLFGWIFFGEVLDLLDTLGIFIILFSGLALMSGVRRRIVGIWKK